MNRTEHLLIKLGEECAEIQKEVAKAQLFGLDDCKPGTTVSNLDAIRHEYNDLHAIVEMLKEAGIDLPVSREKIDEKKRRVEIWMEHARSKGILTEVAHDIV